MSASEHVPRDARAGVRMPYDLAADAVIQRMPRRDAIVKRWLAAADVAGLLVGFAVVAAAGLTGGDVVQDLLLFAATLPLWQLSAHLFGLYDRDQQLDHSTLDEVGPLVLFVTFGTWIGVVVAWLFGLDWGMNSVVAFWAAASVTIPLLRAAARACARRTDGFVQNTLIVGAGDVGQLVGRKLRQHPELGIRLVGFVDADPKSMRADLDGVPILGTPDEIATLVREHKVQRVVVSFSNDRHELQLGLIHGLRELDVHVDLVPRLFEAVGPVVAIHDVEGLKLLTLPPVRASRAARAVKRVGDIVGSAFLLVLVSPLMLWFAWRIKRGSPGPVFFRQERLGKDMEPFTLLKFRTMVVDADDAPHREYVESIMDTRATPTSTNLYKLERPDAVTKVGASLRRTSLDELPQLINVLRGDMSLVGPRPCLEYETTLFEPHHFDRFLVPAGMTGLWQVSARANATFREALDLDAAYARNWSLGLDLRLLARTPIAVLRGRGATS
jgi:exopolysaccharide biosynthesis polyprenyl glycosylphosphotransferase